jgi:hypothetical protein
VAGYWSSVKPKIRLTGLAKKVKLSANQVCKRVIIIQDLSGLSMKWMWPEPNGAMVSDRPKGIAQVEVVAGDRVNSLVRGLVLLSDRFGGLGAIGVNV